MSFKKRMVILTEGELIGNNLFVCEGATRLEPYRGKLKVYLGYDTRASIGWARDLKRVGNDVSMEITLDKSVRDDFSLDDLDASGLVDLEKIKQSHLFDSVRRVSDAPLMSVSLVLPPPRGITMG